MTAATLSAVSAAGAVRSFGEPVTLPTGTVTAVVDLPGHHGELRARGSDTGARLGLAHQSLPALWLREDDAAALREQDPVTVRGVAYLVARLTPDGAGLVRVELMLPGDEPGPRPEWRQWR